MSSRRFRKQIQVYTLAAASDGFGGYVTEIKVGETPLPLETLVATVWADLKTLDKGAVTDLGYTDAVLGVNVLVRKPDTFDYKTENMFIRYDGEDYTIVSVTENIDFNNRLIRFLAVKK